MILPNLDSLLAALPLRQSRRLTTIGLSPRSMRDPDRLLRRAIGAPKELSQVDLELNPERCHGLYIQTEGMVGWSQETTCLGRIWLNPAWALYALASQGRLTGPFPSMFQAQISGILVCDPEVRAQYQTKRQILGGYGHFGLFVAELYVTGIRSEQVQQSPSSKSTSRRAYSL